MFPKQTGHLNNKIKLLDLKVTGKLTPYLQLETSLVATASPS